MPCAEQPTPALAEVAPARRRRGEARADASSVERHGHAPVMPAAVGAVAPHARLLAAETAALALAGRRLVAALARALLARRHPRRTAERNRRPLRRAQLR